MSECRKWALWIKVNYPSLFFVSFSLFLWTVAGLFLSSWVEGKETSYSTVQEKKSFQTLPQSLSKAGIHYPDFTLKTLDEKKVNPNDYRGKYLLNATKVKEVINSSGSEVNTSKVPSLNSSSSIAFNPFEPKPILPQSGILVLILLSFSAGILSFLSPCTLPILPAYFAVTAQAGRARMSMMSVAFFCGLATLFVLMGASASFMGKILRSHMYSMAIYGGVAVVIFGIMTLFGKGFSGATFKNKPASTFIGSFFFGATFALGWTPCVGPILTGILILAATEKTILQGMNLLFFYAVGLGLPLIIISAFCSHLSRDSLFWRILRGKGWTVEIGSRTLLLHTTNLFSGFLLITLGVALSMGYLTYLNGLIPIDIQIWFSRFEEKMLHSFML